MQPRAYSYLRFSSTEQKKGNSRSRQIEGRDSYLARKGLTLDDSLALADEGVSAFRGKNAKTGALARFLDHCRAGHVPKGSYFIVENLDRLSREQIPEALELFLSILRSGVILVTIFPEQEFSAEKLDLTSLILAVVELSRGHSESVAKSERGRANWEKRRSRIANQILTGQKPSWLDIVEGRFVLDPVKAATVRRIFELAASGYGIGAIAKKFNTESVPTISKAKHWHDSYVHKILVNRACVGDFQPRVKTDEGELVPIGEVVKGYFPAVVTEETYVLARQALRVRQRAQGRVGNQVNNLFTGLVEDDAGVKYSMRPRNSHLYLVSTAVTLGLSGRNTVPAVPYKPFEATILSWLRELKLPASGEGQKHEVLAARKEHLEQQILVMKRKIKELSLESLYDTLGELEAELREVSAECEVSAAPEGGHLVSTQALIEKLEQEGGESLRRLVRQQIRLLLAKIVVRIEGRPRNPNKRVFCTINFRDGHVRRVWFETGRKGLIGPYKGAPGGGLWGGPGGLLPVADVQAMAEMAVAQLQKQEGPEAWEAYQAAGGTIEQLVEHWAAEHGLTHAECEAASIES